MDEELRSQIIMSIIVTLPIIGPVIVFGIGALIERIKYGRY